MQDKQEDPSYGTVLLSTFVIKKKRCRVYFHKGTLIWETERTPYSEFYPLLLFIYSLFVNYLPSGSSPITVCHHFAAFCGKRLSSFFSSIHYAFTSYFIVLFYQFKKKLFRSCQFCNASIRCSSTFHD
jgi:hypothetical protein